MCSTDPGTSFRSTPPAPIRHIQSLLNLPAANRRSSVLSFIPIWFSFLHHAVPPAPHCTTDILSGIKHLRNTPILHKPHFQPDNKISEYPYTFCFLQPQRTTSLDLGHFVPCDSPRPTSSPWHPSPESLPTIRFQFSSPLSLLIMACSASIIMFSCCPF